LLNKRWVYQKRFGGYTGREIDEIARIFGFSRRTVKRNVEKWSKTYPTFAELKYIGQRAIPITLEDIAILNQRLKEKITYINQLYIASLI
jgi:transposase